MGRFIKPSKKKGYLYANSHRTWLAAHQTGLWRQRPLGDELAFWNWAKTQGSGFQLAAYLIIGMLSGDEDDCPGFNKVHADFLPVRMAWSLDDVRRLMIADFLLDPFSYIKVDLIRRDYIPRVAALAREKRREGLE